MKASQEERILWQLSAAFPEWVPAPSLAKISLQYSSRIFSLRHKGWQIANRVEVRNGVKQGYFRLATPGTFPNPQHGRSATSTLIQKPAPGGDMSLFGNLALEHRDDG